MLDYFKKNDHFLRDCGAEFTLCEPGKAEITLELQPRHMTDVGRPHAHAGLLYSLAESASAAAVLAYGWNAYAAEGSIAYFGTAVAGKIRAVAKAKDQHEQESGSCRVTVYDEAGNMVARASFTIVYTGEKFEK